MTLAECEEVLTGPQGRDFTALCEVWADDGKPVDRETLWRYLRSVHVKDYSPENLRELVHITVDRAVRGTGGLGQSTVAANVRERLAGPGWPIAVVRMDRAGPSARTARDLGAMTNLRDSPGILLPGVADGGPGLFVVDQSDAVSLYGGRTADVFEAVEDVLAQLPAAPNIKVLLVVRTVDVEQDGRLSRLMTADPRAERFPVGEPTEDSARAVLTASGNDPDNLSPVTLELLRTPLRLAVFGTLPLLPAPCPTGLCSSSTAVTRRMCAGA